MCDVRVNFNVSLLSTHTKYLYSFVVYACVLNARERNAGAGERNQEANGIAPAWRRGGNTYHHRTIRSVKP